MSPNVHSEEISEQVELTPKQEQLVLLLASGMQLKLAAAQLCVSEKTVGRWIRFPHVQEALRKTRQEIFNEAMEKLRDGVGSAIEVLETVMKDALTPAPSRVRAAQIWIEQAVMMYKDAELESKLASIEQFVKSSGLLDDED